MAAGRQRLGQPPRQRQRAARGLRVVGEGHAIGYVGPVRLTVEGAIAHESRSRDDDGNVATPRIDQEPVMSSGVTAEVAWVVIGRPRRVGRAPGGAASKDDGWGGGALELAGRLDALWLGQGASDVVPGGSQGGALALKWWPVDFLAAILAGYITRYEVAPIVEPTELSSRGVTGRASFFWGR